MQMLTEKRFPSDIKIITRKKKYSMKFKSFIFSILLYVILFGGIALPPSYAQKVIVSNQIAPYINHTVKRKILGLYDSRGERDLFATNKIQLHLHAILNYYGYYVVLHDIRSQQLPERAALKQYAAIITWFEKPSVPQPETYLSWLEKNINPDLKLIVFGYTGLEKDDLSGNPLDIQFKRRLLDLIGLYYQGHELKNSYKIQISKKITPMIEFEFPLHNAKGAFEWIIPKDSSAKSWLIIKHADHPSSAGHVVVTTSKGAYIKQGYALWTEPGKQDRVKWIINPFLLIERLFINNRFPIPDPTTLNGRRVFYSHIDGDAFNSFSQVEKGKYSSEIIADFLEEFSQIPVGVSIVVAEVDPDQRGNQRLIKIAQDILAMESVEIASHTDTHPYTWRGPDRDSAYLTKPFDLEQEIMGSVRYINQFLVPEGKKVEVFNWSGDTQPPELAFQMLDKLGLLNINGGDGVFDDHYNSYSSVSPYVRHAGKYWQIHSSQSNENLYTNLWRTDYNGLQNVLKTYKNTDSPYRLSAVNVYYHFYTGERVASLKALRNIYEWALTQNFEMVFPSEYIQLVQGFISSTIQQTGANQFTIKNRGALQTLRLEFQEIDLAHSTGVKSVNIINHKQYLSLDPSVSNPIIQVK